MNKHVKTVYKNTIALAQQALPSPNRYFAEWHDTQLTFHNEVDETLQEAQAILQEREVAHRPKLVIEPYEHWGILGDTGTGKSTFNKELFKYLDRHFYKDEQKYILDSNDYGDFDDFIHASFYEERAAPAPLAQKGAMLVWKPPLDDRKEYDAWLKGIFYTKRPSLNYFDEITALCGKDARQTPEGYVMLMKRGRGYGMTNIGATQHSAGIPSETLSQIKHFVCFRINNRYDKSFAASLLNMEEFQQPEAEHGFWYRRLSGTDPAIEYSSYREFFPL